MSWVMYHVYDSDPELVLAHNYNVRNEEVEFIANMLKTNTTITSVNLFDTQFETRGAMSLANMLKTNTTLKKLDIGWNECNMGKEGIKAITGALEVNESLKKLGEFDVEYWDDLSWRNCTVLIPRNIIFQEEKRQLFAAFLSIFIPQEEYLFYHHILGFCYWREYVRIVKKTKNYFLKKETKK